MSASFPRNILAERVASMDPSNHKRLVDDVRGYQLLAEIIKESAGINMPHTDKNASLMASRMQSVLKRNNMIKYRELHDAIRSGNAKLLVEFTEALTTNKTEFFREKQHFDQLSMSLSEVLEENKVGGRRELRVWCAAASTGQEPYTLAMTILEAIEDPSLWNIKFLASDIDTKVLRKASIGVYKESEMEGVSPLLRQRYFEPVIHKGEKCFRAQQSLRDMIRFAEFNLMSEPYPFEHKFDVIFCRNVLIYFDRPTQGQVVERLVKALRVGGRLFIGHTETGVPKPANIGTLAVASYVKTDED